jgi:hypothetical protein
MEPFQYTRSKSPLEGLKFNLSDRTDGIEPLPGFARLSRSDNPERIFVPFLGFEGDRLQRVLEDAQPDLQRTFPVVGMPGFRPEFSFYSLEGNAKALGTGYLHSQIHLAKANCPFDAFNLLTRLQSESGATEVMIAPIGTKPHALGAILYAILNYSDTIITYDHPVRAPRRTSGEGRLCVYAVSEFVDLARDL